MRPADLTTFIRFHLFQENMASSTGLRLLIKQTNTIITSRSAINIRNIHSTSPRMFIFKKSKNKLLNPRTLEERQSRNLFFGSVTFFIFSVGLWAIIARPPTSGF